MARENSVTEIEHPVMVSMSTLCQVDVVAREETVILKLFAPDGDMIFCQSELDYPVRNGAECICQVKPLYG